MLEMNYSDYKESMEEFYRDFYKEFNTSLRMTGYINEGEFADYEGYSLCDRCCIFISLAKIAIDDDVDISEIQEELKEIFESNIIQELENNLEDFELFYKDYLKVQQKYIKL